VVSFVEANRDALTTRPTAFVQLSPASVAPAPWRQQGATEFANAFVERTGWQPDRVGLFAGAITDTTHGPLTRHLFELVAALATGDTDTAGEYAYTNWDDVEAFTVEFAEFVEAETKRRTNDPTGRQRPDVSTETTGWRGGKGVALLVAGVLLAVYHLVLRPWHLQWGATDEEVTRRLPGDDLVPRAESETTRAVTVDAPCEEVWPWLVQLGQGRGGFYR
jgi:hypothetical protein